MKLYRKILFIMIGLLFLFLLLRLVLKDSSMIEGMDIPEAVKEAEAKMGKLSKPKIQSLANVNKPGSLASISHNPLIPSSGLPINQYCIKASYNSAISGDYVSEEMLGKVLAQGCRFIDFEVLYDSKQDAAFVAYTTDPSYTVINTKNKIVLDTLLQRIAKDAFSTPPNLHDPLFLHLRIKSKDNKIYKAIAKAVKFALSTKLYPRKVDSKTKMQEIMGTVILIIDKLQNLDWKNGSSCNVKKTKEGFVETFVEPLTAQEKKKQEAKKKQEEEKRKQEEKKKQEEEKRKQEEEKRKQEAKKNQERMKKEEEARKINNQYKEKKGIKLEAKKKQEEAKKKQEEAKKTQEEAKKKQEEAKKTQERTPNKNIKPLPPLPQQKQAIINKVGNDTTCVDLSTLYHLESGSDIITREYYTLLSQNCKSPPRIMKDNITTDVKIFRIVEPDKTFIDIKKPNVSGGIVPIRNPELIEMKNFIVNYGAQIVTYNYYIESKSLQEYEDIFNTMGFAILPLSSIMYYFKNH